MLTNVTSLTGNGLKDWLVQRVTAVYIGFYSLYLFLFVLMHPELTYGEWAALFQCQLTKVGTIIAILAIALHSWVGLWTVTTDYLKNTLLRVGTQMAILAFLLAQSIWALMIIWGQ